MRITQSRSFKQKTKKFTKTQKKQLDEEIQKLATTPEIGEEKKADLRGIFIQKFKIDKTLYLLSYRYNKENLELIMLGPHENYYRDLKNYLKK